MADLKISQLPTATAPLAGTELLPVVQGGATNKVSVANLTAGRAVAASSVTVAAGAVGTPSLTTAGDTNTGVYFPAAETVSVATNGVQRLTVDTAATTSTLPVALPAGTETAPALTKTGDLNTGAWFPGADILAFSTAGVERLRIAADGRVTFASNNVALDTDIGTEPNRIPLAGQLGALAFADALTFPIEAGAGITSGVGTIHRATAHIEGGIKVVRVLVDLTGLASSASGDIIGVGSSVAHIGQLPTITMIGGRMTCLETPAGGETDIDLYSATEGTGVYDGAISALTETQIINAGAQTVGTVTTATADATSSGYLYLVSQGATAGTYTAGRFLIEIFGV